MHIKSDFVTGMVNLGVCSKLLFQGVGLVLGNDLAGGQVYPGPIVVRKGNVSDTNVFIWSLATFSVCAVAHQQM